MSDLEGLRFPPAFRGYDTSAVDSQITALEQALADANAMIATLEADLAAARTEIGLIPRNGDSLPARESDLLESFRQSVSTLLLAAHAESEALVDRAREQAAAILEQAEARVAEAERWAREAVERRESDEAEARAAVRRSEAEALLRQAEAAFVAADRGWRDASSTPDVPDRPT